MSLLLDANLSWRLLSVLNPHFDHCQHVDFIGLPLPVSDTLIWNFAKENEYIIVTNDEDFMHFSSTKGFPPKVVLLRTGNQSTDFVGELLIHKKESIFKFAISKDYGVLELF